MDVIPSPRSAAGASPVVEAVDLVKSFPGAPRRLGRAARPPVDVLRGISLRVLPGETVAIVGPSGSGKSTLLYCLSGLEPVTSGFVALTGDDITDMGAAQLAVKRRDTIGFVFQSFNLIESLTARENVALPARLARRRVGRDEIDATLEAVGLAHAAGRRPSELSGGEQQRVAVARVLATGPQVVFADEPTGSLDTANGEAVLRLLFAMAASGRAVVLVTHDLEAAAAADRVLVLRDGVLHAELTHPSVQAVLDAVRHAGEEAERRRAAGAGPERKRAAGAGPERMRVTGSGSGPAGINGAVVVSREPDQGSVRDAGRAVDEDGAVDGRPLAGEHRTGGGHGTAGGGLPAGEGWTARGETAR